MITRDGQPYPLGAIWDGAGVNFALFSKHATAVYVCLFDDGDCTRQTSRIALQRPVGDAWCVYVEGLAPGQRYAYRVHGPCCPEEGHCFNQAKLLIDPYARAIDGPLSWSPELQSYTRKQGRWATCTADSAAVVPKCVVVDPRFDWQGDQPPRRAWEETLIYECHVKGLTQRHPRVDPRLRGTYAGLASPAVIEHLQSLGVTAVELLPVQQFIDDQHVVEGGLRNYWGYSPTGYFAPEARYASCHAGEQVLEFKRMVRELHGAGIEVILDVVYNHTGEGGLDGPTVCFRGIDNKSYYRLAPDEPGVYWDASGCGNGLDTTHPRTIQMIMDSLRYWVSDMHVDGFRFDLAPALTRQPYDIDEVGWFWAMMQQDPVLARIKLIAEPWDLGPNGYRRGRFPLRWSEWNDRYRDNLRRFWRGDAGQLPELAGRLSGSEDTFGVHGRTSASINYVTCHDGLTLNDLGSFEHKHNEANGEHNRDGSDHNFSCNWGHEGPTADPVINALRDRMQRNLLASLALSLGVPMLCAGDEFGRTQGGNNNAYCQDNEVSWLDWSLLESRRDLLDFTRQAFALRRQYPTLRRAKFFGGDSVLPGLKDVTWLRPDGAEMTWADWHDPEARALGMLCVDCASAQAGCDSAQRARMLMILLNASDCACMFSCPDERMPGNGRWRRLLSSAGQSEGVVDGSVIDVTARAVEVLGFFST